MWSARDPAKHARVRVEKNRQWIATHHYYRGSPIYAFVTDDTTAVSLLLSLFDTDQSEVTSEVSLIGERQ